MIALSYAQKKDKKNLFNITSECGTTFAGLVGVVVATPDLHDQPPVEKKKCYCQTEGRKSTTGKEKLNFGGYFDSFNSFEKHPDSDDDRCQKKGFRGGRKDGSDCLRFTIAFFFFFANRIVSFPLSFDVGMVAVYVMKSSMYRVPMFWRFFSAMALSASALFGKLTTASPDGRPSLLR